MLRIKRSVAAAFSQAHFNTTIIDAAAMRAEGVGAPSLAGAGDKRKREEGLDDMAALEAAVAGGGAAAPPAPALEPGTRVKGFVSAGVIQQGNDGGEAAGGAGAAAPANPEELELAEDGEEEEGGEGEGVQLEQQAVPEAVFGSLAKKARTED